MVKKVIVYLVGLFLMAFGVSASVWSDLGVSPIDTVPYVVSQILQTDLGICTTAVFAVYIFLQFLLLGKKFPLKNILQIIVATVQGSFISLTTRFFERWMPVCTNYGMQLFFLLISMAFLGFGIFLYIETEIISMPAEGVAQALEIRTGKAMSTMKICFDWFVVLVSAVLSFCFLKEIRGIREGTLIAAFGVGLFIKLYTRLFQKHLRRFLGKAGT
ncbi:MAG: YczE/YyaS/YitT family protein [Ruminococcus sp.]|jgi:uncharacterized membrane protein YczE